MMRDAIWPAWVSSPTSGLLYVLPTVLWIVWWLFGVNWKRLWPFLSRGARAPLVLLVLVCTQAWALVAPGPCDCLVFVTIPNYWWQLGCVTSLVLIALLCGSLQLYMGWTPPEYPVNPAPAGHHRHHHHKNGQSHSHEDPPVPSHH